MGGILGMEGYTGYLLVAYGVTTLVVVGNVVAARSQFRRTRERLRQQLERSSGKGGLRPVQAGGNGQGHGGSQGTGRSGDSAAAGRS